VPFGRLLEGMSEIEDIPLGPRRAGDLLPFVPGPNDQLTLLPGRSVILSLTVGYSPRR
jgi:hypothetical protein